MPGVLPASGKAVEQFDLGDPASPMACHAAELSRRRQELTSQLTAQHTELSQKVDELRTAVTVREAKTTLAKVTPIKGGIYAAQVHAVLVELAAGLGDEYTDTSSVGGRLPRCLKGDGVLTLGDGSGRVVVEMTDSTRPGWTAYLDEAERNRDATASLGLVRTPEQNAGQTVRVIGPRRVLLAFDPEADDPTLLRTVVHLLRACAATVAARAGSEEVATAEEKITEALGQLTRIDSIKKTVGTITKNAARIDSECTGLTIAIRRLLDQALATLSGVGADRAVGTPDDDAA